MNLHDLTNLYDFTGRSIVVTGGKGVLGREMVTALLGCNANVAVLDRSPARAGKPAETVASPSGKCVMVYGDVLDAAKLATAKDQVLGAFGRIDGLINAAGGNDPRATTNAGNSFFDIPPDALRAVLDLNLTGTILPSQVFGRPMAEQKSGVILNIASMAGLRPLTRIPAYASAKAAVNNFTQWLAVHMAQEYSPEIRVNAVAPGFFLTEQNRFLLTDRGTGEFTERGKAIVSHTPMGRLGAPQDLLGAVLWLLSPASSFVTGAVIPVDGGFAAQSGV